MLRARLVFLLVALLALATAGPTAASASRRQRAEACYQRGLARLAKGTPDARRLAAADLEEAVALAPDDGDFRSALAACDYARREVHRARLHLERAVRLAPDVPLRHLQLATLWHADWMETLDPRSLDRETRELERTVALDSTSTAAWLGLFAVRVLERQPALAVRAAFRAARSAPELPLATLAVATACEMAGMGREADSLFAVALPRLPAAEREPFEDLYAVASRAELDAYEDLRPAERPAFVAHFWQQRDTDPGTPWNDALLEFRSRTAQALFLFHDAGRSDWDERARTWIAWGPPDRMLHDPVGTRMTWSYGTGPEYPVAVQVWTYERAGLKVTLRDRTLSRGYERSLSRGQVLGIDDLLLADLVPRLPEPSRPAAPRPDPGREPGMPNKKPRR